MMTAPASRSRPTWKASLTGRNPANVRLPLVVAMSNVSYKFFTATGIVLIFVAAGLVSFGVHAFGEAGLITNAGSLFNVASVLSESSPLGALLSGMFGYRSAPTLLEAVGYLAYLVPTLGLFILGDRLVLRARPATV